MEIETSVEGRTSDESPGREERLEDEDRFGSL